MKRSEIITLSTLGAIALTVILLYCFVFAPMLFEKNEVKPPEIREGEGIYVKSATLDGEPLDTLRLAARRMMQGGTLTLTMTDNADAAMKQ